MAPKRRRPKAIEATVGFAADDVGQGVAYVQLRTRAAHRLVRVAFGVQREPALLGREVGYAALTAVAKRIADSGFEQASFRISDPRLAADIDASGDVPPALALPYVNLRCQLNRFGQFVMRADERFADDLAARARAEVTLQVAA
jgi:hypothetical protein